MSGSDPFTYFVCGMGIFAVATLIMIGFSESIPKRFQNWTNRYIAFVGFAALLVFSLPMIAVSVSIIRGLILAFVSAIKGNFIPLIPIGIIITISILAVGLSSIESKVRKRPPNPENSLKYFLLIVIAIVVILVSVDSP
jgi:hypothetical protein